MRKLFSSLSFLLILFYTIKKADAQPQWKFHVAFEDATGAKDTIWFIWDSSAHSSLPVDTVLGEGRVALNYNIFNVYVGNANSDTTKTVAMPFAAGVGAGILAMNYQYPINISWDSSLFNTIFSWPYASIDEARIDNDYFFAVNNSPLDHAFNMLLDNQAFAPSFNWFSQNQFPMFFHISRHDTSYVAVTEIKSLSKIKLFPNPTNNNVLVSSSDKIQMIDVFSETGVLIFSKSFSETGLTNEYNLSVESLHPGYYLINIKTFKNQIYHEKIIKIP